MTLQTDIRTNRLTSRLVLAAVLTAVTPTLLLASPQGSQATQGSAAKQDASVSAQPQDEVRNKNEERGLDDAWETFRPKGMEASFEMPKKPKLRERSFAPVASEPAIKVHLHSAVIQNGKMLFVAGWHDLHTIPRNSKQENEVLEGAVATAVANVLGSISDKKNVRLERHRGREISYRFVGGDVLYRVVERVFLVGARQYQFRMIATLDRFDRAAADRFFESVKLLDPDNDLPPRPRKRTGR